MRGTKKERRVYVLSIGKKKYGNYGALFFSLLIANERHFPARAWAIGF